MDSKAELALVVCVDWWDQVGQVAWALKVDILSAAAQRTASMHFHLANASQ